MNCDVLITYSWNRVGYCILRDLTDHGLKVVVADSSKYNICSMSNRKYKSVTYADPFTETLQFMQDICGIVEKYRPKVLIPTHEETLIIAKYREQLPAFVKIPIVDFESLRKAHNKITAAEIAEEIGVPVPKIYHPKNIQVLEELSQSFQYPIVLKLPKSNASKGVYYAHTAKELKLFYNQHYDPNLRQEDRLYIQDYVKGEGYGASYLYDKGRMVTGFVHKRLTEKTYTGGVSTRRVSVRNDKLLKYGCQILDDMNWHGPAMVEFKYDEEKDQAWFIEINPRYWGSLPLPIAAGLSIPYWHYCIATNTPFEVKDYKEGVESKWVLGELMTLVERITKFKLTWKELKSILNCRSDNYDDLKRDDLKAFLGEMLYYFMKLIKSGKLNPQANQTKEF